MPANRLQLQNAFHKPYERLLFAKEILNPVFGSGFSLYANEIKVSILPNKTESTFIDKVAIYGKIILEDGTEITCYEIVLKPNVRLEHSKVAIQQFVRKLLTAGQASLVNFIAPINKDVWRLTLVAKDSVLTDSGIKEKITNSKRFTYLLGPGETCKTAAERFETLSTEKKIELESLVKAFSVEKLSRTFFDEYTLHYFNFVNYLTNETNYIKSVFKGDDKAVRDFVKKLLGRIVFLYFVQKKGWLGASSKAYNDGDKNFIFSLFLKSGGDETFYPNWITTLFFETLNQDETQNKKRRDDNFHMPDGSVVKIPFLNGGLFDKEAHDNAVITFKPIFFHNPDNEDNPKHRGFLDFLNAFNFTVFEDSPDDHTIAVDPEMLGHIFENLLEDNKDKGAFYTPKEIVHYMCQESLTEYLTTHLSKEYTVYREIGAGQVELFGNESRTGQLKMIEQLGEKALNRDDVEIIVKKKNISGLSSQQLRRINTLLDAVKICDPAIGSGAFPMGLLQEVFTIKELIAYEINIDWRPAEVKGNIIQNSIYGVDIEKGAVDIARLRFWLSLVVDDEFPRPLPNLDYKIVVGNSLVSKFDDEIIDIDWNIKTKSISSVKNIIVEQQKQLNLLQMRESRYFNVVGDKARLKKEIELNKAKVLINQLTLSKLSFEQNNPRLGGFAPIANDLKKNTENQIVISDFNKTIRKLEIFNGNEDLNFFDWKLTFPEILNEKIAKNIGFDIVIGNPPYIKVQSIPKELIINFKNKYLSATGKYDVYVLFIELSLKLIKNDGNVAFINPHRFLITEYGVGLRNILRNERALNKLIYFGVDQIFDTATTYTGMFFLKKNSDKFYYASPKSRNFDQITYSSKDYDSASFNFSVEDNNDPILFEILKHKKISNIFTGVYQGVIPMGDDIQIFEGEIEGAFFLGFSKRLNQRIKIESSITKPLLKGENIKRYTPASSNLYIFYPHYIDLKGKTQSYSELELRMKFPLAFEYISHFENELREKKIKYKTNPDLWFTLHRSRDMNIFQSPKILTPQLQNHPSFTYDSNCFYADAGGYLITANGNDPISLKSYLGIFNSKLFYYFIKKTSTPFNNNYYYFKTNYIEPFCIPYQLLEKHNLNFNHLVDYVLFLKSQQLLTTAEQFIPTYFEQIIDGMVYEIYFNELLKLHKREIIKHLGDLPDINSFVSDEDKFFLIKSIFNRLNEKEHPVRINLFFMNSIPEIAIIDGKI